MSGWVLACVRAYVCERERMRVNLLLHPLPLPALKYHLLPLQLPLLVEVLLFKSQPFLLLLPLPGFNN